MAGRWILRTPDVIEAGRLVKDAWEITRLREAGRRISAVALGVLTDIAPGQREQDVAQALEAGLRRTGFTRPAFMIVAFRSAGRIAPWACPGPNHARGDLVVLDFGGVYGGTPSIHRTWRSGALGRATRVHGAVAEAQQAAIEVLAPGVAAAQVDQAARAVLARHGLPIALCMAQARSGPGSARAPRWGRRGRHPRAMHGTVALPVLAAGMVVTIEPGAYIPGWGGVRIEDDLLVTATGAERLTRVPVMLSVD